MHQSLHHVVADAPWSDEAILKQVNAFGPSGDELPADNLDIHKLALQLSEGLPHKTGAPKLADVVRAHTWPEE